VTVAFCEVTGVTRFLCLEENKVINIEIHHFAEVAKLLLLPL